jgi:hypothetical protein
VVGKHGSLVVVCCRADRGGLGAAADDQAAARAAAAAVSTAKRGIGAVAAAATDIRRNTTKYADSVESVYRCAAPSKNTRRPFLASRSLPCSTPVFVARAPL